MITEERLDAILEQLETAGENAEQALSDHMDAFPVAFAFITADDADILSKDEREYLLFLALVVLAICREESISDPDIDELGQEEEAVWEILNTSYPKSLAVEAEVVPDDAILQIFLIDALHADEEVRFLTDAGAIVMYAKLLALGRATGLIDK